MVFEALVAAFALAASLGAYAQDAYAPITFSQRSGAAHAAIAAPPLPFRYVGRLVQNGKAEALVLRGNALHSVAEGDEIDGEYRVERITGAAIRFTYLPGSVKQTLDLTAAR
ncbi:MAG TPA: hypothetical protein VNH16_08850 [Burkholderiales bacterium]|nr:hypothetical protein [Burkholderiales bacterium]